MFPHLWTATRDKWTGITLCGTQQRGGTTDGLFLLSGSSQSCAIDRAAASGRNELTKSAGRRNDNHKQAMSIERCTEVRA
jgi:hypothetical protein